MNTAGSAQVIGGHIRADTATSCRRSEEKSSIEAEFPAT
jgi:hypothetical protein